MYTDYQSNWYKVVTETGITVEQYSFDAWGKRRNAANWSYTGVPTTFTFDRGYTGHEMLDAFGLINMNGRMYDPVIARFLSPDNHVQAPDNSQGYNRYSYCFNNPLIYTDPSGMDGDLLGFNWDFTQHHRNLDMDGKGGYSYNWSSNQYTYNGEPTSYLNVYNNYILPNGTPLPSNTDPKSVYFGKRKGRDGIWYQTTTTGPQSGTLDLRTFNVYVTNTFQPLNNNASGYSAPQGQKGGNGNISEYVSTATSSAFSAGLVSAMFGESARGLTSTTATVASEIQAAKIIGKIATAAKWTGYLGNFVSGAANVVNVYNNPSASNYARATVSGIAISLNLVNFLVPGLGTGLSLGVSAIDMAGGFNWLYNSLETNKVP